MLGIAQSILGNDAFPSKLPCSTNLPIQIGWSLGIRTRLCPFARNGSTQGWGPWSTKEGIIYAHAPASALDRGVALRLHLDD